MWTCIYAIITLLGIFVVIPALRARKMMSLGEDDLAFGILMSILWFPAIIAGAIWGVAYVLFHAFAWLFLASEKLWAPKSPPTPSPPTEAVIDPNQTSYRQIKYLPEEKS